MKQARGRAKRPTMSESLPKAHGPAAPGPEMKLDQYEVLTVGFHDVVYSPLTGSHAIGHPDCFCLAVQTPRRPADRFGVGFPEHVG